MMVCFNLVKNIINVDILVQLVLAESNDLATTSAILDMLIYCLDRADRNLPTKDLFVDKVCFSLRT